MKSFAKLCIVTGLARIQQLARCFASRTSRATTGPSSSRRWHHDAAIATVIGRNRSPCVASRFAAGSDSRMAAADPRVSHRPLVAGRYDAWANLGRSPFLGLRACENGGSLPEQSPGCSPTPHQPRPPRSFAFMLLKHLAQLSLVIVSLAIASPAVAAAPLVRHVVIISVDGFPAYLLDDPKAPIPNVRRLARQGVRPRACRS